MVFFLTEAESFLSFASFWQKDFSFLIALRDHLERSASGCAASAVLQRERIGAGLFLSRAASAVWRRVGSWSAFSFCFEAVS